MLNHDSFNESQKPKGPGDFSQLFYFEYLKIGREIRYYFNTHLTQNNPNLLPFLQWKEDVCCQVEKKQAKQSIKHQ